MKKMLKKEHCITIRLILLICLFCSSSYATQSSEQNINRLIALMNQRLGLIQEVAALKFEHRNEIYDPRREQSILEHTKKLAKLHTLNVPKLLVYSQIMMDTSKQLEFYHINQWKKAKQLPQIKIKTLKDIRFKLLALDKEIFSAIHQLSKKKIYGYYYLESSTKKFIFQNLYCCINKWYCKFSYLQRIARRIIEICSSLTR